MTNLLRIRDFLEKSNVKMRFIKPTVWLIFILSGASALIYEVIWMRQLTLVFGSTVFATSTVLTAFMAGLALGSYYFGRKIDESNMSPLKLYAILEVGIGGFCIIWPLLLSVLTAIYVLIYRNITTEFYTLSLIRFVLTFGILLVPSTLMGGTLPVLTRFFVKRLEQLGTNIGILYALNTFGAVIGTVAAGFILIEAFGITWSLRVAIIINLGVALVAWLLTLLAHNIEEDAETTIVNETTDSDEPTERPRLIRIGTWHIQEKTFVLLAIGISGFCALAYEVLWTRILVFFLGSTTYAFATMLAAFLFGIALGSMVFSRWVDRIRQPLIAFGIVQLGIGLFSLVLMPVFESLYGITYALQSTFGGSRFWTFFSCFLVMSLPTFLMGASFPLVTKIYTGDTRQLGRSIGNVYAVNTVGSILGAFCAGFILIPLLNIRPSIILAVMLNTTIGFLLVMTGWQVAKTQKTTTVKQVTQGIGIGVSILNIGFAIILLLTLNQPLFLKSTIFKTQRPGDTVVDYKEEIDATVTTLKDEENVYRLYVDANQAADASRWDSPSHRVIAHLPLLLHPNPRRALVVGFGMGLTSYSITQHGVQVDAIELSKGVISAAREHFAHVNGNIFENRLFNYSINDGRNHILMTEKKYDMISTGIIHPLVSAGSSNIYTADFYRLCRRILTEDGIMCQWVPLHRLPEAHFKMIVRTFIHVFPETTLWYKYTPDFVILIGTLEPLTINYNDFIERSKQMAIREGLAADDLDGLSLLDSFMMRSNRKGANRKGTKDILDYVGSGPIHTDDRPRLEFFKATDLTNSTAQNVIGLQEFRQNVIPLLKNYGTTNIEQKKVKETLKTYFDATQKLIAGQIEYANAQSALIEGNTKEFNSLMHSAESWMREAVQENENDKTIQYNYGVVSGIIREDELNDLKRTEQETLEMLRQNPNNVQAHVNLGIVYQMQGKIEEAITAFEKSLQLQPKRFDIYMLLGPLYEHKDKYKEALRTYHRYEQIEPNLPATIYAALAGVHLHLNNVEEAKNYATKGIQTDSNSWRSHYLLGRAYSKLNDQKKQLEHYQEAVKIIDRIIELSPILELTQSETDDLLSNRNVIQNEINAIQ